MHWIQYTRTPGITQDNKWFIIQSRGKEAENSGNFACLSLASFLSKALWDWNTRLGGKYLKFMHAG